MISLVQSPIMVSCESFLEHKTKILIQLLIAPRLTFSNLTKQSFVVVKSKECTILIVTANFGWVEVAILGVNRYASEVDDKSHPCGPLSF